MTTTWDATRKGPIWSVSSDRLTAACSNLARQPAGLRGAAAIDAGADARFRLTLNFLPPELSAFGLVGAAHALEAAPGGPASLGVFTDGVIQHDGWRAWPTPLGVFELGDHLEVRVRKGCGYLRRAPDGGPWGPWNGDVRCDPEAGARGVPLAYLGPRIWPFVWTEGRGTSVTADFRGWVDGSAAGGAAPEGLRGFRAAEAETETPSVGFADTSP